MARKQGAYSLEDMDFVKKNAGKLTAEEIAEKINRNPKSVRRVIKDKGLDIRGTSDQRDYAEASLIKSEHWQLTKDKFTEEEQKRCIAQYREIIAQFHGDVQYTEILQIYDFLNLDVELHRCSMNKKEIIDGLERVKKTIGRLHKKRDMNEEQLKDLASLENVIATKEVNLDKIDKSIMEFIKRKSEILKALKATREMRVARIEQGNKTLTGMMSDLLSDPKKMREVGIELEKHRIACDVEMIKLGDLHEFADGEPDFPVLTADTVKGFEKE